jgi:predicted regulator of Ras-like GTPase activity (Roadblock/LC7/MglB family)
VSPFRSILQRIVERVPGALGAIFADWEGEAVDSYGTRAREEVFLIAAHYGVILHHIQSALHLTHFGEASEVILLHQKLDLIVRAVAQDYYVVLAVDAGAHLATALREVNAAVVELKREMG